LKIPERLKVLDNQEKVLDNPIKPGNTVWAKVQGRKGKPVIVRAIVESILGDQVEVEIYSELQLPVRFMQTVACENIEAR
jgi:hypothetical protein